MNASTRDSQHIMGFKGRDSLFQLVVRTPRTVRAVVCPNDKNISTPKNKTQNNASFVPYLWLYDSCPFSTNATTLLSTSDETTISEISRVKDNINEFAVSSDCAVVSYEITSSWLNERGGNVSLWLVADGDIDSSSRLYFDFALRCDVAPSLQPTAAPTTTPQPTALPTPVSGRKNCVCMSAGMIAGITEYCPILATRFQQGCMRNVTRAELIEYSGYCPTLKLDWGPYFSDESDDWQRGRSEVGNKN